MTRQKKVTLSSQSSLVVTYDRGRLGNAIEYNRWAFSPDDALLCMSLLIYLIESMEIRRTHQCDGLRVGIRNLPVALDACTPCLVGGLSLPE